jgi:hypothetical protein
MKKCLLAMSIFILSTQASADSCWRTKVEPYGRGAGYAWKQGDPMNADNVYKRCEADNGPGNCEQNGVKVYPKCKAGYRSVGCCICSPVTAPAACPAKMPIDCGDRCASSQAECTGASPDTKEKCSE